MVAAADGAMSPRMTGEAGVGSTIRRLRLEKQISLQELSRRSGVSTGMLSQIERDLANPSLRVLTKIQVALEASAGALFPSTGTPPSARQDPLFVRRKGKRPFCELGYLTKELLSDGASQSLEMMILHIPPNGSSRTTDITSPAEKGGLLLEGSIMLSVDGVETILSEGDSFAFDGRKPHGFRNNSDHPAKVLWIIGNFPIERHL